MFVEVLIVQSDFRSKRTLLYLLSIHIVMLMSYTSNKINKKDKLLN